jgi:hypothetical protein
MVLQKRRKIHPYTFYYWRTNFELNQTEKQALEKATTPILYTRYFDIDKVNGRFQPVGILTSKQSIQQKIVPVVFIMNRVWENITSEELTFLQQRLTNSSKESVKKILLIPLTKFRLTVTGQPELKPIILLF